MTIFEIELQGIRPSLNAEELLWNLSKSQKRQSPSYNSRLVQEALLFDRKGLMPALTELLQFGKQIHQADHLLQVDGSAAASVVLHAMGFCSLNPIDFGLHLERFIDPAINSSDALDLIARVSMTGPDLCRLLTQQGYSVVSLDQTGDKACQPQAFKASRQSSSFVEARISISLQVITSTELFHFSQIPPEQRTDCLMSEEAWNLLGQGETAGIPGLESEQKQSLLRASKPRTIEVLARLMASEGLAETCEFQEELMSRLHEQAGMPLRAAWELVRAFTKGNPDQIESLTAKTLTDYERVSSDPDALARLLAEIRTHSRQARCKSHKLAIAYLAVQSAFVRALGAKS